MNIRKPKATMAIRVSPVAYDMIRTEAERNNLNIADAVDRILKIDTLKTESQKDTKAEDSQLKIEFEKVKSELEKVKKEHENTKAEEPQLKIELERTKNELEKMRKEYEEAKKEADKWAKSMKKK